MTRLVKNKPWKNGLVSWKIGNTVFISVVFTWLIEKAVDLNYKYAEEGYNVKIGGPAYDLFFEQNSYYRNALYYHNENACFTTRGCIRKCYFCAVPKIEGAFKEIKNFRPASMVCDNNFLASSVTHFNHVIDRLSHVKDVDFNQGLDARLLKPSHIDKLAGLDLKCIRFSWDNIVDEQYIMDAVNLCLNKGIPRSKIRIYVLIGFNDTPDDAYYRLNTLQKMKILPFPMRYQPLNCLKKNAYVAQNWTDQQLKKYVKYFSNLRITNKIPFNEFEINRSKYDNS